MVVISAPLLRRRIVHSLQLWMSLDHERLSYMHQRSGSGVSRRCCAAEIMQPDVRATCTDVSSPTFQEHTDVSYCRMSGDTLTHVDSDHLPHLVTVAGSSSNV